MKRLAMMGRAERFATFAASKPSYRALACEAAAKASALYPAAVHLFDFAKVLELCGHHSDARQMFAAFLARQAAGPLSPIDSSIEAARDMAGMIAYANQRIAEGRQA